jgi:predicted GH43/DUF377 family glycosyl hydrolase
MPKPTRSLSQRTKPRMPIERTRIAIVPNHRRVVLRPFDPPGNERKQRVIARVLSLTDDEIDIELNHVLDEFHGRHQRPRDFFLRRFEHMRRHLPTDGDLTLNRRLLLGAYFSQEYSLESAALFNPSMVWHPNQSHLSAGCKRFLLSLRAVGEGHVSSITFRTGTIDARHRITVDEPSRFVTTPEVIPDAIYDKNLFYRKLIELGLASGFLQDILVDLESPFTLHQLESRLQRSLREYRVRREELLPIIDKVVTFAKSNYQISYPADHEISGRIVFPFSPSEINGMEDARFVEFFDEDGSRTYYATYTAYGGGIVLPQLLETQDFLNFKLHTLNGPAIADKGMALFPRKLNGHFAMLSRQDGEHLFLMYSDMIHFWHTKEMIAKPTSPWEFVQLGNCGSPIETERGWLVLTHGVGAMRRYCIGAMLLDLDEPTRVIGRRLEPLLAPNSEEREGYVPNVVYSCGSVVHNGNLILPYAMSDYASTFAIIPLDELLDSIR